MKLPTITYITARMPWTWSYNHVSAHHVAGDLLKAGMEGGIFSDRRPVAHSKQYRLAAILLIWLQVAAAWDPLRIEQAQLVQHQIVTKQVAGVTNKSAMQ